MEIGEENMAAHIGVEDDLRVFVIEFYDDFVSGMGVFPFAVVGVFCFESRHRVLFSTLEMPTRDENDFLDGAEVWVILVHAFSL